MSSILWATPSKEWTVAPKPKPGRKPKHDPPTPANNASDVDDKSRRIQNRAAQRAFRERKQSQLAELQARVQSYEQGQVERSVAIQGVAKRLKEENELLRQENNLLREKIARMEDRELTLKELKNLRDRSPASNPTSPSLPCAKRVKLDSTPSITTNLSGSCDPYPLTVTTQPTNYQLGASHGENGVTQVMNYIPAEEELGANRGGAPASCGFCSEVIPCLCNPIAEEEPAKSNFDLGNYQHSSVSEISGPSGHSLSEIAPNQTSILDNLPPYQPAVPLPRKQVTTGSSVISIFPLVSPQSQVWNNAMCSGDPSNCLACADDTFGKAFCTAIGESVALDPPCVGCPCDRTGSGAVALGQSCRRKSGYRIPHPASTQFPITPASSDHQTMPTNEAWKRIKAHPNASFADLKLLAEVVARRSKCTGPTVVISPALGEATPERVHSPEFCSQQYTDTPTMSGNPPPAVGTQDIVLHCGQQKVREVYADDVQTALHLLDTKFS